MKVLFLIISILVIIISVFMFCALKLSSFCDEIMKYDK